MLRFFLIVLLAVFSFDAVAGYKVETTQGCFETREEACGTGAIVYGAGGYAVQITGVGFQIYRCNAVWLEGPNQGYERTFTLLSCSTSCPAGEQRYNGICAAPVSCNGGTVDANNVCQCPSGQSVVNGQCLDDCEEGASRGNGDKAYSLRTGVSLSNECRSLSGQCAAQASAGGSFGSAKLLTSLLGCGVSCQLSVSGDFKYACKYTGGVPEAYTCIGDEISCGKAVGSNVPESQNTNVTAPENGSCPAGTSAGTVNGQPYCASSANTNISNSGNTGQNPNGSTTEVETTITQTATNPDGSTSTTTITTRSGAVGTSSNPSVVKIDPNSVSNVSIKGSGNCDPTKSDYAQCIGMPSGSGSGSGTGDGDGDGDGEGGECDPESSDYLQCLAGEQSAYGDFGNGEKTLQTVADNFYTGVEESSIGQLASSISGGLPAGSCPVVNFEMFGRNFTMDFWCEIYSDNGDVISTVARAGWVLMGILIILGA